MNFDQAEQEIRAFFETNWAALTAIAWPDTEFTVPNDQTWVKFNCVENDGGQVSMGNPGANRFRQFGLLTIQIFQPQGQGSTDAREKAATLLTLLKGAVTTNGVYFFDVYGRQVGNDGNGFYQINVISNFYYDEIT